MEKPKTRCRGCSAPVQFQPGAGSRLCPFCGFVNLVREQTFAVPTIELKTDEIFHRFQKGELPQALADAEKLLDPTNLNVRLAFYRAAILLESKRVKDAIYALIDLTGLDAPAPLRADLHTKLAEALIAAERFEEALESAKRSDELLRGHPAGRLVWAQALAQLKRAPEAIQLLEEVLPLLPRQVKITFPPPRHVLLLFLARLNLATEKFDKATGWLEELLLQETAAPLPTVAEAAALLQKCYQEIHADPDLLLPLLRQGTMLDPENRRNMIDALRDAALKAGSNVEDELRSFQESRDELLREIRGALFDQLPNLAANPTQIGAELPLSTLSSDPDQRTDLIESVALRLDMRRFDRGTLYPLQTLEDFRRWVSAWRLRDFLDRMKRNLFEARRIEKLKTAHQDLVPETERSVARTATVTAASQRHHRGRWWLLGTTLLLALLAWFLVTVGDRFLDQFEGRLLKIECRGPDRGPPCTLHVAAGEEARGRYRDREQSQSWFSRLLGSWLDRRVLQDGTILYPLDFLWGNLSTETYAKCLGQPIAKMRFTFAPLCTPR